MNNLEAQTQKVSSEANLMEYALNIIAKKRYTSKQMEKKLKEYPVRKAKLVAARTGEEVKLPTKEDIETAAKNVLNRLIELNYINDEKYVSDFFEYSAKARKKGVLIIKRDLKIKGIEAGLIDEYLAKNGTNELEAATEVLEKKSHQWIKYPPVEQKSKAFRFLAGRGFAIDVIYNVVETWYNRFSEVEL